MGEHPLESLDVACPCRAIRSVDETRLEAGFVATIRASLSSSGSECFAYCDGELVCDYHSADMGSRTTTGRDPKDKTD